MRSSSVLPFPSLLAAFALFAGCEIRDDSQRPNQVEELRVLGIASEPADLAKGETAGIDALLFVPDRSSLTYQWTFCPFRGGSGDGYECLYSEEEVTAAWDALNTGTEFPGFDLGTESTAEFTLNFEEVEVLGLCQNLASGAPDEQVALFTCLSSLSLSIGLRVESNGQSVFAFKDIPVVFEEDAERNSNPILGDTLVVRDAGVELPDGTPLRNRRVYDLEADVPLDQIERFTPAPQEGAPPPEERQESLYLSWFVSGGNTHREGEQRTFMHDGGEIESLIENRWEMPFEGRDDDLRLFLVLRDERGGVSFGEHSFVLEGR